MTVFQFILSILLSIVSIICIFAGTYYYINWLLKAKCKYKKHYWTHKGTKIKVLPVFKVTLCDNSQLIGGTDAIVFYDESENKHYCITEKLFRRDYDCD